MKNCIGLGMADSKLKSKPSIAEGDNIIYYESSGDCYNGKKLTKGNFTVFKEGDTIKVKVNRYYTNVEWSGATSQHQTYC